MDGYVQNSVHNVFTSEKAMLIIPFTPNNHYYFYLNDKKWSPWYIYCLLFISHLRFLASFLSPSEAQLHWLPLAPCSRPAAPSPATDCVPSALHRSGHYKVRRTCFYLGHIRSMLSELVWSCALAVKRNVSIYPPISVHLQIVILN